MAGYHQAPKSVNQFVIEAAGNLKICLAMLVHTKITTLEEPEIEFRWLGDSVVHAIRLHSHKNAISWPFKVLGSQCHARKITSQSLRGSKTQRPNIFWAQDQFFRFHVSPPSSTKAQSRTLTTTLVSGTTRSRLSMFCTENTENTEKLSRL